MPIEPNPPQSTRQRVQRRRAALREAGLRPLQIWVPDTRVDGFAEECQKQSSRLRLDTAETDTLDWIEQATDDEGWS